MEKHRVMSCDSVKGNPQRHFFVEVEKDSWVEVIGKFTHQDIEDALEKERTTDGYSLLRMSTLFLIADSFHLKTNIREDKPIIA